MIATDNPSGVTDIAAVLGHVDLEASEAHYNKAKQIDAAEDLQDVVASARGKPRRRRASRTLRRSPERPPR
jgi:hypothetical protein